jgi:hypothetical protein
MKIHFFLFFFAIPWLSGCSESSVAEQEPPLFLHWFTRNSDQEYLLLQTMEIELGEEIATERLSGKILRDSRGLHATLEGSYETSVGYLRNYVELDERFAPAMYSYGFAIHGTYFVLSADPRLDLAAQKKSLELPFTRGEDEDYTIDLNLSLFVDPE